MSGCIFILSSPSGTGKTTLRDELLKHIDSLSTITTITSRDKRSGEVDGVDYYFKTREEIEELNKSGKLVEMTESFGNLYGTPKDEITSKLDNGENLIIILDSFGKPNFDKYFNTIGIFIDPPPIHILKDRLMARSSTDGHETQNSLETRLKRASLETNYAHEVANYDYFIDNNTDIEIALETLKVIINEEIHNSKR